MAYRAPLCDLGPIRLIIYARNKSFVPNGQMSSNRNHQHPKQQHLDLLLGGYILKAKWGLADNFYDQVGFRRNPTWFVVSASEQLNKEFS